MREGAGDGSSRDGVGVEAVTPGSPADRAGIVAGDRILSVSGRPVEDLLDLHFLTSRSRFTLAWRDASGAGRKKGFRLEGRRREYFRSRSGSGAAATGASSASSTSCRKVFAAPCT